MKKFLTLLSAVVMLAACSDDDHLILNSSVLDAFHARFPDARSVIWTSSGDYLVADFYLVEDGTAAECEAWFTPIGEWRMTQLEMPYAALPLAVRSAFEAGDYAAWGVDEVVKMERDDEPVEYIIVAEGLLGGVESEAAIFYSEDGELLRYQINPDYEWCCTRRTSCR
jgi:hypothetical protein